MKKIFLFFFLAATYDLACVASKTNAEIFQKDIDLKTWKLENYINNNVVVWFAGTDCENGKLTFPDNASDQDKNRFWSTVSAAKISGKKLFVRYETSTCVIESFGFPEEN